MLNDNEILRVGDLKVRMQDQKEFYLQTQLEDEKECWKKDEMSDHEICDVLAKERRRALMMSNIVVATLSQTNSVVLKDEEFAIIISGEGGQTLGGGVQALRRRTHNTFDCWR